MYRGYLNPHLSNFYYNIFDDTFVMIKGLRKLRFSDDEDENKNENKKRIFPSLLFIKNYFRMIIIRRITSRIERNSFFVRDAYYFVPFKHQ